MNFQGSDLKNFPKVGPWDQEFIRGMIGFDREIGAYTCMAEVSFFLKTLKL